MFSSVADFVSKANVEKFSVLEYARFLSEAESWAISQIIQSALAERTEQCAKIADYERDQAKALFMECKDERNAEYAKGKERAADFIQLRIRALSQPEMKS